jgi:hypothetical protein
MNPTLTYIKDLTVTTPPNVTVALSIANLNNRLYGISRLLDPSNPFNSKLQFHVVDDELNVLDSSTLCLGEDPRLITYQGQLLCISWTFNPAKGDLDWFMINLSTGKTINLVNQDLKFNGKNIVPYTYKGNLYFIYALQPLTILKFEEPNILKLHYTESTVANLNNCKFCSSNPGIGDLRAGSNGLVEGDMLSLFSRTGSPNPHRLHYSEINLANYEAKHIDLEPNRKSGVHDPYSYFKFDDQTYLTTTKTDTFWDTTLTKATTSIYKINFTF